MSVSHSPKKNVPGSEIKLYPRRWLNMILFMAYAINGGIQWVQFTIIKDIIVKFYDVSSLAVEWTCIVYMLGYTIFAFPAIYLLNKVGIRNNMIIASSGICVGAWIKMFSTEPDRFFLVILGQSFEGIFTVLTFGMAARFTAIWFGAKEISLAGALALFGDQLGTALAFLFPTLMVQNSPDSNIVADGLRKMHIVIATTSTIILILIILFFKAQPTHPPSFAQTLQKKTKTENIWKSLWKMLSNPAFGLITLSYSLCLSGANALWTLLNEVILNNFPGHNKDLGNIGFLIMFTGMIVSPFVSHFLDRTKKFRENAIILNCGAFISFALFTISLKLNNINYVYVTAVMIGIFVQSIYVTAPQIGIEIMYPMSEGVCTTTMFFCVQLLSMTTTLIYGSALKEYGDVISNIGICLLFLTSAVLSLLLPANFKRQNVEKGLVVKELEEFLS